MAVLSGSGISWAIFKSALRSRQITTPAPHHSKFFTGRMPFLPPNQLHQSTEGLAKSPSKSQKCSRLNRPAPSTHPNSLMSVIASEQACCRSFFAVRRRINAVHRLRMELHRRLRYIRRRLVRHRGEITGDVCFRARDWAKEQSSCSARTSSDVVGSACFDRLPTQVR